MKSSGEADELRALARYRAPRCGAWSRFRPSSDTANYAEIVMKPMRDRKASGEWLETVKGANESRIKELRATAQRIRPR